MMLTTAVMLVAVSSAHAAIPQTERDALVAFYNSTNGPVWAAWTKWLDAPGTECTWTGVKCDAAETTVISLELPENHISGSIPAELGSLTALAVLDLNTNQLTGSIPATLGNLTKLGTLNLGGNQLSGSIPTELGSLTALAVLDLNTNQLTGSIPAELGSLTVLSVLDLNTNQLTGSIPATLGNLTKLWNLNLGGNQLNGSIPPTLGGLPSLYFLGLQSNQLTGEIPSELGSLPNLNSLSLSSNRLSGSIPTSLASLPKLHGLYLPENELTGPIPPELANLTTLTALSLFGNALTGPIPPELGNLTNLLGLYLHDNQLSGPIPTELGKLTRLKFLYLSSNRLSGPIPPQLGNLGKLQTLHLYDNQLTGSIPPELGQLIALNILSLGTNELSGAIPAELGNLTNLDWLWLGPNQLSGSIPPSIGNLIWLIMLDLQSNELSGEIPEELGHLRHLEYLYLNSNQLTGELPSSLALITPIYYHLDLSYNGLTASDPDAKAWADFKQPDWAMTQTVPPTSAAVASASLGTATLTWSPIIFTGETGRYEVWADAGSGEFLAGATANKSAAGITLTGLPAATTAFRVRSITEPHSRNGNRVTSHFSETLGAPAFPSLSIHDATITEGDAGSMLIGLAVVLSSPGPSTVTVRYSTTNGLAEAGSDYVSTSAVLTFNPGETSKTASVAITGDPVDENNESFYVDLSDAIGATIADGHAIASITDDDDSTIVVDDITVAEGDSGESVYQLGVRLSTPSSWEIGFQYQTTPGTATSGIDYVAIRPTFGTFAPGETSKAIPVTILGDETLEGIEWFFLLVRPAGPAGVSGSGLVRITDDDSAPPVPDPVIDVDGCVRVHDPCSLSARSASGAGTSTWSYEWRLDGQIAGTNASYDPSFSAPGTFSIVLTTTNSAGSGSTSTTLNVESDNPCPPEMLCSLGGRFHLKLDARDHRTGKPGPGVPTQDNDLFGFFSLPTLTANADNPEVFVKVLDGRKVNGNFWVFYGGLTDLEYTLTVNDTVTDISKTYSKPGGSSLGGFDVGAGVTPETCRNQVEGVPGTAPGLAPCAPGADHLCLNGSRFRVEVVGLDQRTGATGAGSAIIRDDLFGYFSLPALTGNPDNPEVFVKVLDGRPVNGHFWVFFSGLTDLEYTLTVTDTISGQTRTYWKAPGSACGAFDVSAF